MKRGIRLLALLLALLLLGGSLAGCASSTRPLNYFKKALFKTLERRFGGDMGEILLETLETGSVELTYGGTDLAQTPLENARLKVWFHEEGKQISAVGALGVGGKTYDGKVFLTDERVVVSSEALLGSTDFGLDFATLHQDMANSIFRNNSNTAFARPEIGDGAAGDIITLKNSFFTYYESFSDVLELSDEVADEFLRVLTEYAPHSKYSADGAWHLELTVENVHLSRALRETRANVVGDRDFCRELRELAKTRDAVASVRQGTVVTEWTNKVENFIASPLGFEDLCAKIDALPAFRLQLNGVVGRWSGVIQRADVSFGYVGGEQVFAFSADLTDDSTNVLSLTRGGDTRTLTYRVNEDGMRYYKAELTYEKKAADGTQTLHIAGKLDADRKTDSFTLALSKGEKTRVFAGSFDKDPDGFYVSVSGVTVNGEAHSFSMGLTVKVTDKAEAMPVYENLATVTEHRFQPIATRMKNSVQEFRTAWGGEAPTWRTALSFLLTVSGAEEEIASIPPAVQE